MTEKMFSNPGKKIKTVAVIYFWIISIGCIIMAFAFGFTKEYHSYYYAYGGYETTVFNAGIFFGFLLGGPLGTYITSLLLVGFGELVENSQKRDSVKESEVKENKEPLKENKAADLQNEYGHDENGMAVRCAYVCKSCKHKMAGWYKTCPACGATDTLEKI